MAVSNDTASDDLTPPANSAPDAIDLPQADLDSTPITDQLGSEDPASDSEQEATATEDPRPASDSEQEVTATEDPLLPPFIDLDEQQVRWQQELTEVQAKADQQHELLLRAYAENENLRKRSARDLENERKYGLKRFIDDLLPIKDSMELGLSASQEDGVDPMRIREGMELILKMLTQAIQKVGVEVLDPVGESFDPQCHEAKPVSDHEGVDLTLKMLTQAIQDGIDPMRIQEGMDLTLKMLTQAIQKVGVDVLDPAEETLDLQCHEAKTIQEGMELTLKMLAQAIQKVGVDVLDPTGEVFDPQFHEAMTVQDNPAVESGTVLLVIQKGYLLNERLIRPAKVIVAK